MTLELGDSAMELRKVRCQNPKTGNPRALNDSLSFSLILQPDKNEVCIKLKTSEAARDLCNVCAYILKYKY